MAFFLSIGWYSFGPVVYYTIANLPSKFMIKQISVLKGLDFELLLKVQNQNLKI
jgi:hypothetical protein